MVVGATIVANASKVDHSDVGYVGRPYRASPSEGYPGAHAVEQERIVREALTER